MLAQSHSRLQPRPACVQTSEPAAPPCIVKTTRGPCREIGASSLPVHARIPPPAQMLTEGTPLYRQISRVHPWGERRRRRPFGHRKWPGREMLTGGTPLYRQISRVHPPGASDEAGVRPFGHRKWLGRETRHNPLTFHQVCSTLPAFEFPVRPTIPLEDAVQANREPSLGATDCSASGNAWPLNSTRWLSLRVMKLEPTCLDCTISPIVHGILASSDVRTREERQCTFL
jgi:hypothetical protein